MIILVSDLHLTDTPARSTFNQTNFFDSLEAILDRARTKGVTDVTLILLGDIFELLKSEKWVEWRVRPWEPCDERHIIAVDQIVERIIAANPVFFQRLVELNEKFNVRIEYIPGNHDRPINTEMGQRARERLGASGFVKGTTRSGFKEYYEAPEHALFAMHGHLWDPSNRYGERTVPIGDAIVIELVQQLPVVVGKRLGLTAENDTYGIVDLLHEIDNIRPHTLRVIAQWINGGLSEVKEKEPKILKEIDKAFTGLVKRIIDLQSSVPFETFAHNSKRLKALSFLVTRSSRFGGFLSAARFLPSPEEGPGSFRDRARREFGRLGAEYKYIVCGHTHAPMVVPIDSASSRSEARLYMNTGTWRRVRPVARSAEPKRRTIPFASWEEECAVSIFSGEEQQKYDLPAFYFHRLTRGN